MRFLPFTFQFLACASLLLGGVVPLAEAQTAPVSLPAASTPEQTLVLPVRLVDGHLILGLKLYQVNGAQNDAISLELAFDSAATLTLDGKQYGWLQMDPQAAKAGTAFVRGILDNGATILIPGAEVVPESLSGRKAEQDRLTRLFAGPLGERKVAGVVGLGFLKKYRVSLDMAKLELTLTPAGQIQPLAAGNQPPEVFTAKFNWFNGLMVLPVQSALGPDAPMIFGSSGLDTVVDAEAARLAGQPTGQVAPVTLIGTERTLDLAERVAFRPGKLEGSDADWIRPLFRSGVNFIQDYKVEIDWEQTLLRLTEQKQTGASEADRAFFAAEAANTAEAYLAYLKAWPKERMGNVAAQRAMALLRDGWGVSDDELLVALRGVAETAAAGRATEDCLVQLAYFAAMPDRTDLVIQGGLLALEYAKDALVAQDVYRLHRLLGEQYLAGGKLDPAWKHLLSAAFVKMDLTRELGQEHAFMVAYDLGRIYEQQGRVLRAYSRYKAALATPQDKWAPSRALKQEIEGALTRLREQIPAEDLHLLDA